MQNTTHDEQLAIPDSMVSSQVARVRLLTGLLQGFALYYLYFAGQSSAWPEKLPYVFMSLLMVIIFVPVIFVSSLGHIKNSVILRWLISASVMIVCLTIYDIWRVGFVRYVNPDTQLLPSPEFFFVMAGGLFISHALVYSAATDNRLIARYSTYFESAWKLGIQLIFAELFVGILWAVFWLGESLFILVKLYFLQNLLNEKWFSIPVSVFAFSFAMHITDVKPGIVRGIRTLLLVLMSWLLPVVTFMVAGFILSLPFTGLEPLWATRNATAVLLGASAVLIILINTAFQNGEVSEQLTRIIRVTMRLAALLLAPLLLIAIYSLGLRVQQYGWTIDRIIAASCLLVSACYTGGYVWAAIEKRGWLHRIAPTNIAAAFLVLVVLVALLTPLADPARLSVNSQVNRLLAGIIKPAEFDYDYLKFSGERYGLNALNSLRDSWQGADASLVREKIDSTQTKTQQWDIELIDKLKDNAHNITIWPKDSVLPAAFIDQTWNNSEHTWKIPECMRYKDSQCEAFLIDLNSDTKSEILIISKEQHGRTEYLQPQVFMQQPNNQWALIGTFAGIDDHCVDSMYESLRTNTFKLVAPAMKDIEANGSRFKFVAEENYDLSCSSD